MHNIFPKLFSQGRSTTFLLGPQAMLILPRALLHPYSFQDPYSFCAPCCSLNRLSPMTTSITTWQKKHGFLDQSVLDSNSGHSFPNSIFGWVIKFLRSKMKLLLFHRSFVSECLTLCNPMDCSTLGFPRLHYLSEFAQTHAYWVSDAIQPSHPLLPLLLLPSVFPSIRIFSNESAFHTRWPKYWSFLQLQNQSFQWSLRTDFL